MATYQLADLGLAGTLASVAARAKDQDHIGLGQSLQISSRRKMAVGNTVRDPVG